MTTRRSFLNRAPHSTCHPPCPMVQLTWNQKPKVDTPLAPAARDCALFTCFAVVTWNPPTAVEEWKNAFHVHIQWRHSKGFPRRRLVTTGGAPSNGNCRGKPRSEWGWGWRVGYGWGFAINRFTAHTRVLPSIYGRANKRGREKKWWLNWAVP